MDSANNPERGGNRGGVASARPVAGPAVVADGKIRGSWPGGPKRDGEPWTRALPPQLQRVEEIEARIARRRLRLAREARNRRIGVGLVFAVLLALTVGWGMGLRSRTSAAELLAAKEAAVQRDFDISREINRTLLELWKMEDAELMRERR